MKRIDLPLTQDDINTLNAGDAVLLSGVIYTARDAAHARMVETLANGGELPINLNGACIYYAGPCPTAPGEVIGPCGPTTSGRMDKYSPELIKRGQSAMIGKGMRSAEVVQAMQGSAVYFAATGGAAMLIASCVKEASVIAYDDLGAEAIRKLVIEDMPVIVAIDAHGGNLYERN